MAALPLPFPLPHDGNATHWLTVEVFPKNESTPWVGVEESR